MRRNRKIGICLLIDESQTYVRVALDFVFLRALDIRDDIDTAFLTAWSGLYWTGSHLALGRPGREHADTHFLDNLPSAVSR